MEFPVQLFINALIAGILLGGFYAAVTIGISISFGILDIVNIAHPAFIILGSYIAYIANQRLGLDPILVSILVLPAFYYLGSLVYPRSAGRKRCAGWLFSSVCCSSPKSS
jgi:branched-chain amino acid transport system permease protein